MQKIVFNGHYLMYFDTGIAEYWRATAIPYEEAMHVLGGDLYVVRATLEYKASARYDDRLQVCLRCERVGTSSMTFKGAIFCNGKLLVTGELVYVYADPATQKSMPVPPILRDVFLDFEAGKPMTRLELGDWEAVGKKALPLRVQVFVNEQGVPEALEHDGLDAAAHHAVILNQMDMPVATGRLLPAEAGVSRIGRMAVSRVLRGSQLGETILQTLLDKASSRGDTEVVLHAQTSAQNFYAQLGFDPDGAAYDEAGIAHITMRKRLIRQA